MRFILLFIVFLCLHYDSIFAGCSVSWLNYNEDYNIYNGEEFILHIEKSLVNVNKKYKNIKVSLDDNTVLLQGMLPYSKDRIEVSNIVWRINGVIKVDNQIIVSEYNEKYVKSEMLSNQIRVLVRIRIGDSINFYSFESLDNDTIYMFGNKRNDDEYNKILSVIIRNFPNKKIVDYIKNKE